MKGFVQVVRTAASAALEDALDPLSMFAVQKQSEVSAEVAVDQAKPAEKAEEKKAAVRMMLETPALRKVSPKLSPQPAAVTKSASAQPSPVSVQAAFVVDNPTLLLGEYTIISLLKASVQLLSFGDVSCALFMTNYRLIFQPFDQRAQTLFSSIPALVSWLQVPLPCIDKLEREKRSKDGLTAGLALTVHCKDCRQLRVTIKPKQSASTSSGDYDMERAFSVISAYAFPNNLRHLFAFSHKLSPSTGSPSQSPSTNSSGGCPSTDLLLEFSRLGVLDNNCWRVSEANAAYKLCSTYPTALVVPAAVTDDELFAVATFRSGQRLPAMCWLHAASGASLWRSSQPKVGKAGSCAADEKLLELVAKSIIANRKGLPRYAADAILSIVDCRSRTSAMANYAAGAGYESTSNYPSSKIEFYGIPNIHAVRDSLRGLSSILLSASTSAAADISFGKQVEETGWLSNLRLILRAGWETASSLSRGTPVLVHCSHGWDRTAQVCCIAELLLDPFYRTFEGFPILIDKEWGAFGHPFQMRCGHGQERNNGRVDDEMSPIFLQFLDCLQQIHRHCAHAFEFNARYILTVAEHVYSCRFSNFLFNCDCDRDSYRSKDMCTPIWVYLEANRLSFVNPLYVPTVGLNCGSGSQQLPVLSQLLRGVCLWTDFFLRFSSALSLPPLPLYLADHLRDPAVGPDPNFVLPERLLTQHDSWEAMYAGAQAQNCTLQHHMAGLRDGLQQLCGDSNGWDAETIRERMYAILQQANVAMSNNKCHSFGRAGNLVRSQSSGDKVLPDSAAATATFISVTPIDDDPEVYISPSKILSSNSLVDDEQFDGQQQELQDDGGTVNDSCLSSKSYQADDDDVPMFLV